MRLDDMSWAKRCLVGTQQAGWRTASAAGIESVPVSGPSTPRHEDTTASPGSCFCSWVPSSGIQRMSAIARI